MAPTRSSTDSRPGRSPGVLVVGTHAPTRARLAAHVWRVLPPAQVHELSQLTDLVYRVAGSGVDLVLMDADSLQPVPMTPLLVQMLKGIRPTLRIVCVARLSPAPASALPAAVDASLAENGLGDWLRDRYGSGESGPPAFASWACGN